MRRTPAGRSSGVGCRAAQLLSDWQTGCTPLVNRAPAGRVGGRTSSLTPDWRAETSLEPPYWPRPAPAGRNYSRLACAFRTSHLSAPDWAVAAALRNWRVRGPGRRALNPISPKTREAGLRKRGPGPGSRGSCRRGLLGRGRRPPALLACLARPFRAAPSRSGRSCGRRRRARLPVSPGAEGRGALTFRALRPTPRAFTSPFTGSAPVLRSAHAPASGSLLFPWQRVPHQRHLSRLFLGLVGPRVPAALRSEGGLEDRSTRTPEARASSSDGDKAAAVNLHWRPAVWRALGGTHEQGHRLQSTGGVPGQVACLSMPQFPHLYRWLCRLNEDF